MSLMWHRRTIGAVCALACGQALGQRVCNEQDKLVADDGQAQDTFGIDAAIDGDRLVVGTLWDDDRGVNAGAVYVFERVGGAWVQAAKLLADDGGANDNLGRSVSVSGNRVIAGASGDGAAGSGSGSAYIFELVGGVWIQAAKLSGLTAGANDRQGWSVGIDGDAAVVCAHRDDDRGNDAGAAYVFERSGAGTWSQTAKLVGEDTDAEDEFAHAVAISGDTVLIGAHEDDPFGSDSGSAYVFARTPGGWEQRAKLTVDEATSPGSHLGRTVAIDGDRAVLGAPFEHPLNYGAAYVFERTGGAWAQQGKLVADVRTTQEWFASSVGVSGDRVLCGSFFNSGEEPGSAFVFGLDGGAWMLRGELLASDGENGDGFGRHVALSGGTAVVAANADDDAGVNSGSVYVFDGACPPGCPADFDGDGALDFTDVLAFVGAFASMEPAADLVPDGSFDFLDVSAFLAAFGTGCP